jgi:hypothetical protein
VRVAITFRHQAEHERCGDEKGYSSLGWREAKSLPHFIDLKTPALFNHKLFQQSATESNFGFQREMSPVLQPRLRGETFPRATKIRRGSTAISGASSAVPFAAAEPKPNDSVS